MDNLEHTHPGFCQICADRNEMAHLLRSIVLRMKLAIKHGDEFIFAHEDQGAWDRSSMMTHWIELSLYNQGFDFYDLA